jgi:hypothetical protein
MLWMVFIVTSFSPSYLVTPLCLCCCIWCSRHILSICVTLVEKDWSGNSTLYKLRLIREQHSVQARLKHPGSQFAVLSEEKRLPCSRWELGADQNKTEYEAPVPPAAGGRSTDQKLHRWMSSMMGIRSKLHWSPRAQWGSYLARWGSEQNRPKHRGRSRPTLRCVPRTILANSGESPRAMQTKAGRPGTSGGRASPVPSGCRPRVTARGEI